MTARNPYEDPSREQEWSAIDSIRAARIWREGHDAGRAEAEVELERLRSENATAMVVIHAAEALLDELLDDVWVDDVELHPLEVALKAALRLFGDLTNPSVSDTEASQ